MKERETFPSLATCVTAFPWSRSWKRWSSLRVRCLAREEMIRLVDGREWRDIEEETTRKERRKREKESAKKRIEEWQKKSPKIYFKSPVSVGELSQYYYTIGAT